MMVLDSQPSTADAITSATNTNENTNVGIHAEENLPVPVREQSLLVLGLRG